MTEDRMALVQSADSTNPLERLNKEIKRRSSVIGIFLNNAAIVRLFGTRFSEQTDERQVTGQYMRQESLARVVSPEPTQAQLPEQRAA